MRDATLSVGQAAARVGLSVHTLRWYERQGLLAPVARDAVGRRRYTEADLEWLGLLIRLRRTGMPVREMRRYVELAWAGEATLADRLQLFEEHRDRVQARIGQLQADLEAVNYKVEIYRKLVEQE